MAANIGEKTEIFLKNNCKVPAVEPNKVGYASLNNR